MTLDELGDYKQKIVSLFFGSQDIIDLLLPKKNPNYTVQQQIFGYKDENGNVVFKGQLFPYFYTDGTGEEARTFVLVETDAPTIDDNGIFKTINLYIYEFTDLSLVRLTDAEIVKYSKKGYKGVCRTDVLAMAINRVLSDNNTFGLSGLKLKNIKVYRPTTNSYYGRVMTYSVKCENIGGDTCGN